MQQQIFSISQVNEYLRTRMDADPMLAQIAVRGEISNYKMYPSGHHYFSALLCFHGGGWGRGPVCRF